MTTTRPSISVPTTSGTERLPTWVGLLVMAIPLLPSPALVPVFQVVMVGFALFGLMRALSYRGNSGVRYQETLQSVVRLVVALIILTSLSVLGNDPTISGGLKTAAIRAAFLIFVLIFTVYLGNLTDSGLKRIFRKYLVGISVLSVVAIYISLTGNNFTGEILRPSRGLGLLPSGFKTAGLPRSYGEFAIIMTGGFAALLWMWRDYSFISRWSLFTLFAFGTSVSHSRNVYLSTGLLFAVFIAARIQSRSTEPVKAWTFRGLGYAAIFSPVIIAAFLGSSVRSSSIGAYFVGEGVFERNADSRSNHVRGGLDVLLNDPGAAINGTSLETWFATIGDDAVPHNQFISLLIFGIPVLGLLIIHLTYFRNIKRVAVTRVPERTLAMAWLASSVFAFSNYQGLFAPSAALMLGLIFSIPLRQIIRDGEPSDQAFAASIARAETGDIPR